MFAVEAASLLMILVWTGVLARRSLSAVSDEITPAPDLRRRSLRFAGYSSISALLYLIVWRRSEFFFLNHYSANREIAFYSIAFGLVAAVVRLPSAMGQVLAPAVATLLGAGAHERIRRGFSRALRLLLIVTLPIAAATAALGPEAIRLFWGDAYGPTREPLLIMVAASLLTPVTVLASSLLAGLAHVRLPLVATAAAGIVDPAWRRRAAPRGRLGRDTTVRRKHRQALMIVYPPVRRPSTGVGRLARCAGVPR
jgi:O-antigen/teichoic acid export membrane protein